MRTDPSVLRIVKVTAPSLGYFCSTISSTGSTAKAPCANKRNAAATMENAVAAPLCRGAERCSRRLSAVATAVAPSSRLFIPQRHHRIDLHGAAGGNVAGEGRSHDEQADDTGVGHDISGDRK